MARALTAQTAAGSKDVVVFVDPKKGTRQPHTFHLCPLGLQFYSPKRLHEFDMMEFTIDVPAKGNRTKKHKCTGAVVRCQREQGAYRVWIKFIDLSPSTSESIRCTSKNGKHLCCFCENF